MTAFTPLDAAHEAMEFADAADAARLRFYATLADTELCVLLEREVEGATLSPQVFPLGEGPVVLAFDSEDRLAAFAEGPAPYAALPGRVLAGLLAGQGLGLGLNLGVAPSSMLLPPDAVAWLAGMVEAAPEEVDGRPDEIGPPDGLPEAVRAALLATLARARGIAAAAWLASVRYGDGREGFLLAFTGAEPGSEEALAHAAGGAVGFSDAAPLSLDVTFLAVDDPAVARLARVAERIDLSPPAPEPAPVQRAPGSDPDRPPILR